MSWGFLLVRQTWRVERSAASLVVVASRVNPTLAGYMPENAAGFGDVEKIDRVYMKNEIRPIMQLFLQVNGRLRRDRRVA